MEPDLRCPDRRIRLLESDDYFDRFIEVLQHRDVPLTSFTVMSIAPRHRNELFELSQRLDTEFAVHSFTHDTTNPASEYEVHSSRVAFEDLWQAAPRGYRSPNCLIDRIGLETLISHGFCYDSSIVPSMRFDGYAYNHMRLSRTPFRFTSEYGNIVELPIACLRTIRLPFIFSYIKLLGLSMYSAALAACPLPSTVVLYLHPYDLYVPELAPYIPGWKRRAHLRNARTAFSLLADVVDLLKRSGYRFVLMRELAERLSSANLLSLATSEL